jgi:AcrR family transcriptional regulator
MKGDPRRQAEQRQAILEAAAASIAAHGYHGMSMRELAAATGKGLSSLYHYFPSKEEILFALQQEAFQTLIGATEEALAGVEEPAARLYAFLSQHLRYLAERPDVMRVLIHEAGSLPPARRRILRQLKERYFAIGRGIVGELIAEGCGRPGAGGGPPPGGAELDRIAYSVFGMLNWIYGWYRPEHHGSARDLARTIHGIALCGLVARCPYRAVQDQVDGRLRALASPPLLGRAETAGESW